MSNNISFQSIWMDNFPEQSVSERDMPPTPDEKPDDAPVESSTVMDVSDSDLSDTNSKVIKSEIIPKNSITCGEWNLIIRVFVYGPNYKIVPVDVTAYTISRVGSDQTVKY